MDRRRIEWTLALLSIVAAILTQIGAAAFLPYDPRAHMIAGAFMGLSLWLVIGLYPGHE